jgi:hypothetical protein
MSTATAVLEGTSHPGGRPRYSFTFRAVAVGLITGLAALWAICTVVSLLRVVGLSSPPGSTLYAPWVIDGPWSLAAVLAWGLLVSSLVAAFVGRRMQARTHTTVSRALMIVSVAAGGYGPWLLGTTVLARVVMSLLLTPAIVRVVVFEPSGQPRQLPARLELSAGRLAGLLLFAALVVVAPFALLHPFALRGSGESGGASVSAGWQYDVQPGQIVKAEAGLETGLFPVTVTAVRVLGQSRALRILSFTPGDNAPVTASGAGLPMRIAAGQSLWVSYKLALRYCTDPPASITRIRVSYRELGLALTQTVPLAGSNTLVSCTT